jgi:hypothetical protein
MSEAGNSSAEMDMFTKTSMKNSEVITPPSQSPRAAFVTKCLHPPSAVTSFEGLPTNDARTQVITNYVNVGIINQPSFFNNTTLVTVPYNDSGNAFTYAIMCPTGARVLGIPYVLNTPSGLSDVVTQDLSNVMTNDQYNFKFWQNDVNLYRPIYKSLTTYLNATAFNDQGIVTSSQFNPNVMFAGSLLMMSMEKPDLFNYYIKSRLDKRTPVTVIKKGATTTKRLGDYEEILPEDDYQKFMLFPKYIREQIADLLSLGPNEFPKLDPNTNIQVLNVGQVGPDDETAVANSEIPTPSQIMNNSARSYTGKAKDGTFTVQRLNTLSPAWLAGSNTANSNQGLYQCYSYTKSIDGSVHFVPLFDNCAVGTTGPMIPILNDTLWTKDMTWTYIYYQGLFPAQSGIMSASLIWDLIAFKYYTGYEIQPTVRSAWSGLVKMGPKPDMKAMQELMDLMYELKDCLPAKYNLAGIGAILGQIATSVAPSIIGAILPKKTPQKATAEVAQVAKAEKALAKAEEVEAQVEERASVSFAPRQAPVRARTGRVPDAERAVMFDYKPQRRQRSYSRQRSNSRGGSRNRTRSGSRGPSKGFNYGGRRQKPPQRRRRRNTLRR